AEQSHRAAVAVAVDPRQRWFRQRIEDAEQAGEPLRVGQVGLLGGMALRLHLRKIGARAKRVAGTCELHHPHCWVACAALQRRAQRGDCRAVKRIALGRPVDGDARDARSEGSQYRLLDRHLSARPFQMTSMAMAVASPPPMHRLAIPRCLPRAFSAYSSVVRMRAPVAPIGCPSAQAPPLTFTFAGSSPSSLIAAIATTANASFTSYRSTSAARHSSSASNLRIAPTGASVNHSGSRAKLT